jgi:hypothetical protein
MENQLEIQLLVLGSWPKSRATAKAKTARPSRNQK